MSVKLCKLCSLILCLALSACSNPMVNMNFFKNNDHNKPIELKPIKRIVFLGDSITYQGGGVVNASLWLKALYPKQEFEIINLGLPSETITGLSEEGHAKGRFPRPFLHERLDRVLSMVKPDLVIAMYGMTCGIYEPYSDKTQRLYETGVNKLYSALKARGIKVLYVTPPIYDHQRDKRGATYYNDTVISQFSSWLLKQRKQGWQVVDLNGSMAKALTAMRAIDPSYYFQPDGVHFNEAAQWVHGRLIASYFAPENNMANYENVHSTLSLAQVLSHDGEALIVAETQKMELLRNAWLSHTGHKRPHIKAGLELKELDKKLEIINKNIEQLLTGSKP